MMSVGDVSTMASRSVKQFMPTSIKAKAKTWLYGSAAADDQLPSLAFLSALMERYRVEKLANVSEAEFRSQIDRFTSLETSHVAGAKDLSKQRELSQKFRWGHDHDFGSFRMDGAMGRRHLRHLAVFMDRFGVLPPRLDGRRILDVGCWTGGASLLLAAMGARVTAIDEVGMYVECLNYLSHAFAVEQLEARCLSLYRCTMPEFQDTFDFILFAGVLYHVTDPVVALRTLFNCLRDGGVCMIETTGVRSNRAIISYERRAWNWFDLSPASLARMLADVGFADIQVDKVTSDARMYAMARRLQHVDMRRDGLSVPDIR